MFNSIRETPTLERLLSPHPDLNAPSEERHLKNVQFYFIFVILSGLSILSTLYFDFQRRDNFDALQETGRQWSNRAAEASQLLSLAADVYEPGYEKFKSRSSEPIAAKMRSAGAVFNASLTALQKKLHRKSVHPRDPQLVRRLESARTSMHELEIMIGQLNARARHNQSGIDFGELIILKDKYHEIREGLYQLRSDIEFIQLDCLNEEHRAHIGLSPIEFLIKLQAFLMILGSVHFGFRIGRQASIDSHAEKQHAREFAALYDTSVALSMRQDLPSLLRTIANRSKMLLAINDAAIFLLDKDRGELEVVIGESVHVGSRLRVGEGIAGIVAQTQEPLIVNDYSAYLHPTSDYQNMPVKAVLSVPMLFRGQLLGVLGVNVASGSLRKFTEADARLLSLFAGQAASAVHYATLLDEMRKSEERFKIAAQCASDLVYDWDLKGDHAEYFGPICEVVRAEGLHLPETRQEYENTIHFDDRARILTALENHFKAGKPFAEEYLIIRSDGSHRYVADRAQAILDKEGRPVKLIGALSDITERKQAEKMKSDFVSFVTHQLRTPLTGVKWMLELAIEESENLEGVQSYIQDARNSTERLIRLVNNMLDISRLERGSMQVVRNEVDLPELTRGVLLEMSPMILEKDLRFSFQCADGAPKPYADPQLLRQVILNLASNAAKYTPPGGEISIRISGDDGQIRWEIKDSGIGIPKIDQEKLFQKFYRAGNVLTVETEGTGLGLYFVRLIVERHGGRVWYESEEGAGSTFQFSIPVVSKPERTETDGGVAEHPARHVA